MGFLLSLNLSHWIGSFSTVGWDSHLGFRQKGLREAFSLHFFIFGEESEQRREQERRARFSRHQLREIFSWHGNWGDICWHRFRGVRPSLNCRHRNRGVQQHLLCAQISRSTATFIAGRTVRIWHWFRGRFQAHLSRQQTVFLWHGFRGRTTAFIAVRTVRIFVTLHRNRGQI